MSSTTFDNSSPAGDIEMNLYDFASTCQPSCDVDIDDDFEDEVIDESLWEWDGLKRGWNGPNQGDWEWSIEEKAAQDGFLNMRVWGPQSGNTYGAEAWIHTLYDYNDGNDHTVHFSWEAVVNVPSKDDHFNRYFVQITDGYISPDGNNHWPRGEAPIAGTANLLCDPDGEPGKLYPNGRDKSEWTMTIEATGEARLYDEHGDLVKAEKLDPSFPWHLRFMVIDATSSGFPAGDIEMNLYDFSSTCTIPRERVLPDHFKVTRGVLVAGELEDLFDSDDSSVEVQARRPTEVAAASVEIVVTATVPSDAPAELTFTVEAAGSAMPVRQRVELYNYDIEDWELVDERDAPQQDTVVEISINHDTARFVQHGTGQVKARIGYLDLGVTFLAWGGRYDQVYWTVVE